MYKDLSLREIIGNKEGFAIVVLNILKIILSDYGIDVEEILKQEGGEEVADVEEIRSIDTSAPEAPFTTDARPRLTLRDDSSLFVSDVNKIVRKELGSLEAGESLVYAVLDMDDISKLHRDFGRHLNYAGKVRIVIGEIIERINEGLEGSGIRVTQYFGGGDKSFILIKGKVSEAQAKDIIAEICRCLPLRSAHRLAVAELDVTNLNTEQFEIIKRVTGYYPIIWEGNKYTILIDVLENETPDSALLRTLGEFNLILEREYGCSLRGRMVGEIPPFAVSMGAVYVGSKITSGLEIDGIKERARGELNLSKNVSGKRTVRLVRYVAPGQYEKIAQVQAGSEPARTSSKDPERSILRRFRSN